MKRKHILYSRIITMIFVLFLGAGNISTIHAQSVTFREMVQELRRTFSGVGNPNPSVSFFYDLSPHESDSTFFRSISYDTSNVHIWYSLYREMYYAAYDTSAYLKDSVVFDNAWDYISKDTIPLAIMDYKYNILDSGALDTNLFFDIDTLAGIVYDKAVRPYAPYTIRNIFAGSPLYQEWAYSNPVFMVNPRFIFADPHSGGCNSCVWPDYDLRVDFNDGTGWHTFSQSDTSYYSPMYTSAGVKLIRFGLFNKYTGILTKHSVAAFRIYGSSALVRADSSWRFIEGLTINLYRGCENSVQRKFVIYLEGLDPLNNRSADQVYNEMIREDTVEQLKNFGYEFLVVNFNHPYADIRENAFRVMDLINHLKGRYPNLPPLVVIGESMGGLIGRFALRSMEVSTQWPNMKEPPHDPQKMHNTRLFISIDAPNKGANIPLAYQCLYRYGSFGLSYLYSEFSIGFLRRYGLLLDGISTKQMLLYHISTDALPFPIGSSTYDADWRKYDLDFHFSLIGRYPEYCKKVTVSNGSWLGKNQTRYWDLTDRAPNDYFLRANMGAYLRVLGIRILGANLDFNLRSNPDMVSGTVFRFAVTKSNWRIVFRRWKPRVEYTTSDLIRFEKEAVGVKPYCTKAGSLSFPDTRFAGGSAPSSSKLNVLGAFWLNTHTSDGHIYWDAELGIPWIFRVGATFDLYTDGTSFGFVPPMSSFDDDSFYVKPLDDNMLAYAIDTIMSRSPFDAVFTNPLDGDHWRNSNKNHVSIPNPRIAECVSCTTPFATSPVYSNLMNREIGDDTLWLENTHGQIPFLIEAERGLYVNFRNPYYNYSSKKADQGIFKDTSIGRPEPYIPFVLSKEADYEILSTPHEFVSNNDFDETGLVPGSYTHTTGSMVLCCLNYRERRVMEDRSTGGEANTNWLKVFPNPVGNSKQLLVSYHLEDNIDIKMEVYNMLGQRVADYSPICSSTDSICNYSITLSVPSGMYILRVSNGKEQQTERFVIQ